MSASEKFGGYLLNIEEKCFLTTSLYLLQSPVGGRVTIMQTVLPTAGPGSLQSREDPSLRSGKVRPLIPEKFYYEFQL